MDDQDWHFAEPIHLTKLAVTTDKSYFHKVAFNHTNFMVYCCSKLEFYYDILSSHSWSGQKQFITFGSERRSYWPVLFLKDVAGQHKFYQPALILHLSLCIVTVLILMQIGSLSCVCVLILKFRIYSLFISHVFVTLQ